MKLTSVNDPAVVAEVEAVFAAYERALVANELGALEQAFWASDLTVRYGLAERQYGAAAIDAWRRSSPGVPPGRRLGPTVVVTFGRDVACVSTEFTSDGTTATGRQSQTWARLGERWQIVAAHVSLQEADA